MSVLRWLRLRLTFNAVCEGGPFDGELRSMCARLTVGRDGREWRWNFKEFGEPGAFDLGCYELRGVRFIWRGADESNQEKVRRFLEIERLIKETVL